MDAVGDYLIYFYQGINDEVDLNFLIYPTEIIMINICAPLDQTKKENIDEVLILDKFSEVISDIQLCWPVVW